MRGIAVGRSRLVALFLTAAAAVAVSVTIASPAQVDTFGPIQNYGNGLCMRPQDNSSAQGALIVQMPCDQVAATTTRRIAQASWPKCRRQYGMLITLVEIRTSRIVGAGSAT
jgi:hypothetical protein